MKLFGAALSLGMASFAAFPAAAGTVTLDWLGSSATTGTGVSAQINSQEIEPQGEFGAGALRFQEVGALDAFTAWCLEISELITDQATYSTTTSLLDADRESLISRLFTGYSTSITSEVGAAAIQLAVWEIVEEENVSNLNLLDGRFTAASSTAAVIETANLYLGSLDQFDANYEINYFQSANSQNIISVAPVPLPASMLLLGAGVGALALTRRRRTSADG